MTTELVQRLASEESNERDTAFTELMKATQSSVWRMHWALWAQLPAAARVRREEYADEMTQETFIKGYERIVHGGSRPRNFRFWIHKVGQRLSLDRLKAEHAQKRKARETVPAHDVALAAPAGTDPAQIAMARQTLERFSELLDGIHNANMREAFLLDLNTDLTRQEIAEILGVSLDTVTSYCARVRKVLKRGVDS